MYVTLKIRLKTTEDSKACLSLYERIYHKSLYDIAEKMYSTGVISYRKQNMNTEIDRYSHWNLYQLALKKYNAEKMGKNFQYERSSTWNIKSFTYYDGTLILYFGASFQMPRLILPIATIKSDEEIILNNRVIRLDITHGDTFWFANFVIYKM